MANAEATFDPLKYVFIPRAKCPKCAGSHLKIYKTMQSDDRIVTTQYARCKDYTCGHTFKIVIE